MPRKHSTRSALALPAALLAACLLLLRGAPAAATVPSDLCSGNPCIVSGAKTVAADTTLDFGSGTELRFAPSAVVTIASGSDGSLALTAGRIILQAGAAIVGGGDAAAISLTAVNGNVELQRNGGTVARIDVSANQAGEVVLTASGAVVLAGDVDVRGTGLDSQGGSIEVDAGAAVSGSGSLLASASGRGSSGGSIAISAGNGVTLDGTLATFAADFDGGEITIDAADGDVALTGTIDVHGGSPEGTAGGLDLGADKGNASLSAAVAGFGGTGSQDACGDGASISITAALGVSIGGAIDVSAGTQCVGGELVVNAVGDVRQLNGSTFKARAPGTFGFGGRFSVTSPASVVVRDVDLSSSGVGGIFEVTGARSIVVRGLVDVHATGSDGIGGTATLQGCNVSVLADGTLDTRGSFPFQDFGVNLLQASGSMSVAGTLRAASANLLEYKGSAPVVTGTVAPAATITLEPALPDCAPEPGCGNHFVDAGEACDDGNHESCDGCSADCKRADAVCGDGTRECAEQCDDHNVVDGDGCQSTCTLTPPEGVRVRGVPLETAGCLAEWALNLPNPALDPDTGLPSASQRCADGDPSCDADGAVDGVCSIDVQVCLRVPDPEIPACAPKGVKMINLDHPKPPGDDLVDQLNSAALVAALKALGLKVTAGGLLLQSGTPVNGRDTCTEKIRLEVPHGPGGPGERTFRIGARSRGATPNMLRNGLVLACDTAAPSCGDGVQQSGESCDDGNVAACDGCSADCRVESCGDGIVECGEECDLGDANGGPKGSCSATCERETPGLRVPGSGARRFECAHEWSIMLADESVPKNTAGIPRTSLTCTDNDPTCDLDDRVGVCGLRIYSCFAGADARLGCAAQQVSGAIVKAPKVNATAAPEVAARAAIEAALDAVPFPVGPGEACTEPIDIELPVRQSWLDLKLEVPLAATRASDRDGLRLKCVRP